MSRIYNIHCDESGRMESDRGMVTVLGGVVYGCGCYLRGSMTEQNKFSKYEMRS